MASLKIRVFPDPATVALTAADRIVEAASSATAARVAFSLALSGGQTPKPLYELLSDEPYLSSIDWPNVHIYFADERCVPPTHADSNFRLASQALLDFAPIPPANIHRMRGEIEPQPAALEYAQLLDNAFPAEGLDLVILGLGDDGHTASLFPETSALAETQKSCVANFVPKLNAWRLTLTAAFLNRSREILVLVTDAAKSQRVRDVLEGPRDPERLPIQLIAPPDGRVTWMLAAGAAGMNDED